METFSKIENLESLSTIKKILLLQRLLKEMASEKERFIDNKNKMLEKLDSNCYKYFDSLIYMKEIFDYCNNNKVEKNVGFKVIKNSKKYLKELYQPLYDFCFLIRNDNSLMLKIIELMDAPIYGELSNFFVNFLYVNVIKSSFEEDELMIMIYLLLEKQILKIFPEKINSNNVIPINYFNKTFLYYVFKDLTRKIDLRNFLCTILNDFIIKMESFATSLSVEINTISKYLNTKERNKYHSFMRTISSLKEGEVHNIKKKFKKMKKEELLKKKSSGLGQLKRANKIDNIQFEKLGTIEEEKFHRGDSTFGIETKFSEEIKISDNSKKFEKRNTESINEEEKMKFEKNKIIEQFDQKIILSLDKNDSEHQNVLKNANEEEDNDLLNFDANKGRTQIRIRKKKKKNNVAEIDAFFELNSITTKTLKDSLSKYENNKDDKNILNLAMKEYLNILISNINEAEKNNLTNSEKEINNFMEDSSDKEEIIDKEIYSNSLVIEELKAISQQKEEESFKDLMRKIRFNHIIITKIIEEIINKLKENLVTSPYCLKFISKIISILLNKYNDSSEKKLSNYQIFLFKINFLIGNIILPAFKKPEYNGVASNIVISELSKENLSIIFNIFDKIVTGSLFNKTKDKYMVIFNKFIIDKMPIIFELIQSVEKNENNFELPGTIKNLIDSSNEVEEKRKINYDFFVVNPKEKINYQSICFSWKIMFLLSTIIEKNKKLLIEENENIKQKLILEKFIQNNELYQMNLINNKEQHKNEYIYFTKVSYDENFNKIIDEDNFTFLTSLQNNILVTSFKKCMIEVLNYTNKIQQENFYKLTENQKKTMPKNDKSQNEDKNKKKSKFNLKSSLIKIDLGDKKDDADFKNVLFPQIKKNINLEINKDMDNEIVQHIIFSVNYINLYIGNIPENYQENNYSLLFDELINETKNNTKNLKSKFSALFEFYKKIKEAQKLNMMNLTFKSQVKDLEKLKCIEELYNKLKLELNFKIVKDPQNIITNIEYITQDNSSAKKYPIKEMIDNFPDFHQYEDEYDDILDIEENANTADAINNYFSEMVKWAKNEEVMNRYNLEEKTQITNDLKNYIISQMYGKLFPFELTKQDIFFYNKCKRLQFLKPENLIKDKKIINENLWKQVIKIIDNLDDKLTPFDKLKTLLKAFDIMQNSITFSSGKDKLGVDDLTNPLVYIFIKSKPKNICSNYKYCELYLDSKVGKGKCGLVLSQLSMFINIIKNLKCEDLNGVSEEQFGKDDIIEQE